MIKIFFDLDGTLIDYSKRNYFVYKKLVKNPLKLSAYWTLKRSKSFKSPSPQYVLEFVKQIESSRALDEDNLFSFTEKVLKNLKNSGVELYLVSYRDSKIQTIGELKKLGIYDYFYKVCLGKGQASGVKTKAGHIKKHINKGDVVYVVGDTEDDILSAKKLGVTSVAVLSGIRDKKRLLELKPDYIIKDIRDLLRIV